MNPKREEPMRKRIFSTKDLKFYFGAEPGVEGPDCPEQHTCAICAREHSDHGLLVWLEGPEKGYEVGHLCGECLTSSPKRLAELLRERAPILREIIPDPDDDEDTNIRWADNLLLAAEVFDTPDSLDAIPGGTLARKIGEAYLELDNTPKARKGKAA